jgi:leader peptidase (prepilin peptidase)/N-methyltransferase
MSSMDVLAASPALLVALVFLLGLLVGSFLNVVIYRLPIMLQRQWSAQAREILAEEPGSKQAGNVAAAALAKAEEPEPANLAPFNLVVPRSRCPACRAAIKAHQNIPVLSWLLLGGKCAACKAPISLRYPLVELATGVLSAVVAWQYGWHWQTLAALVFTWALVALTMIDADTQLLPDVITLPLLWLGLLLSLAWHAGLQPSTPVDPASAIIGAAAGYLFLWSIYWLFKLLTGKEGMGYGDFKLFAAFGAWLGWQMLPLILLLSAVAGAAIGIALIALRGRDRNQALPFGPYLAVAGWVALIWGDRIVGGYLRLSGLSAS